MKLYSLAHRQETDGDDYDYVYLLDEVGKGELVSRIQRLEYNKLYQYVVFETVDGEICDKPNADEWYADYRSLVASEGFSPGDIVCSVHKTYPLYRIVKTFEATVWLQPCDEDGERPGPVQKSVPYHILVKY